jgi:hypothetical protein
MKRSSGPRRTANFFDSVHQHLYRYATAAVTAALSALAMTQQSGAKIVYTPTHVQVNHPYNLDINNDGITDFTIRQIHLDHRFCRFLPPYLIDRLTEAPSQGNGAVISVTEPPEPAALVRSVEIGPNQSFVLDEQPMAYVTKGYVHSQAQCVLLETMGGPWLNVSNRYLGLKFQIKGKTHYGWARLSVQVSYVYINATLTGYAYETTAGKSIKAGQTKEAADDPTNEDFGPGASLTDPIPGTLRPASLGALAMGAPGLSIWRRDESVAATSDTN